MNVEIVSTPEAPWAPLMIAVPPSERLNRHREATREIEQHVQTALVHTHDQARDDLLDDLTERKRHDGEVVARQTQDGNPDNEPRQRSRRGTDDHGDDQTQAIIGDGLRQAHGRDDAGVRTDAHKARMPERQVAGNADHQIERERHDDIGADRHELAHDHAGDHAVRLQEVDGDESGDHERVRDEVPAGFSCFASTSSWSSPTPSPDVRTQTDPRV